MARPALSSDDIETMRERLAAAALAIYRSDGLDAISFRRLAEAEGISHTLSYRYFDDKEALLARVRALCFIEFDRYVRERERHVGLLSKHMDSIAQAYIDYGREHAAEYRLMFSSEQPPPDRYPELLAARRRLFDYAVTALDGYVRAGHLKGDARTLVHALWITLHGLMSLHVASQLIHGRSLQQLARPLVERALQAPAKSRAGLATSRRKTAAPRSRA